MFQYSIVAEVVLLRGLNAEGPLRSHATHRLKYVEGANILELRQTDVQGTEGTWQQKRPITVAMYDSLSAFSILSASLDDFVIKSLDTVLHLSSQ